MGMGEAIAVSIAVVSASLYVSVSAGVVGEAGSGERKEATTCEKSGQLAAQ